MEKGCTVILPTYNEEANIGKMIETLREMYPSFYVVVMDDNSKDSTIEIVSEMSKKDDHVKIYVRDPKDRGLSASIFEGIQKTQTEYFINMDSDFQHPPEAVEGVYEELICGAELAIGVRKDRTNLSSFMRWLGSWGAHYLAAFTLKLHNRQLSTDIMSGFFGGETKLCQKVIEDNYDKLEKRGFKALFDIMKFIPEDADIREYPFQFGEREGGESKLSSGIVLSLLTQCDEWGKFLSKVGKKVLRKA